MTESATINLAHGSGGSKMHELIEDIFVSTFDNSELAKREDQARLDLPAIAALGDRLAMTTDSYVIDPIFFPGGDIGKLAVCGTVNDLVVGGALPLYLTCGLIIEEGLSLAHLKKIVFSMKEAADRAGVKIVCGDTKVVNRGAADKIFINTSGIGVIHSRFQVGANRAQVGDRVIVTGTVGDHGAAIMAARSDLGIETDILSDCAPLNQLVADLLAVCPDVHCMRDATRGGVATVLNEFARASKVRITLNEADIPVRSEVRGVCEILGFDHLYMANEGKLILIVSRDDAPAALETLRSSSSGYGRDAAIIGEVESAENEIVTLKTIFGAQRVIDMLSGEQLPRIC